MLIKFLRHSRGSGRAAVDYLVGSKDHTGRVRPGIVVLRGDPEHFSEIADWLNTAAETGSLLVRLSTY